MTRREALTFIKLEDASGEPTQESSANPNISDLLTAREIQLLGCLSNPHSIEALVFWATAGLARVLAEWGHWFSSTIHHCPCHSVQPRDKKGKHGCGSSKKKKEMQVKRTDSVTSVVSQDPEQQRVSETVLRKEVFGIGSDHDLEPCPMIGRTAVLLAGGLADVAIDRLKQIQVPPHARALLDALSEVDPRQSESLLQQFHFAVSRLIFRTNQNFSYWRELPWTILVLMRPFVEQFASATEAAG